MTAVELLPAVKLTISVGGDERHAHHPLYQEVLRVLQEEKILGATLIKGVMSYGIRRSIHTTLNEVTMENLPIIIEAIDERPRIERAATRVAEMLGEHGLIEMQSSMVACGLRPDQERSKG